MALCPLYASPMLQINNLSKHFGHTVLFEDANFSLMPGEKLGFVGRNGSGKSTLFSMILGEMAPDGGEIVIPKGYRIGTLPQHIHFTEKTVLEEGCLALTEEEQWDHYKVERILFGLGFSAKNLQEDPNKFSGGFQIRINLAKALVQSPNMLLLDEPTNYLDIVSQRWLKEYLASYPGEIIIITHDREFMDGATTHIMGLHRQQLRKVKGDTLKFYTQIQEEEENYERTRKNQEHAKKHLEKYINRFRASARRASQAQSRVKQLAKFDDMKELKDLKTLDFSFNHEPCPGKNIMNVRDLQFGYQDGPLLINNLSFAIGRDDRLGIIGKNGKGKSTLLNLLAGELQPTAGSIKSHPSMQMGHFGQTNVNRLNPNLTIVEEIALSNKFLNTKQARSICGTMMFEQDLALKKIEVLSGGERSRVLLGKMLANKSNLLLLDEPTNHLDQESIEGLIEGLEAFGGAVVLVTHSEMILHQVVNKLVVFHRGRAEFIDGSYEFFLEKYGWDDDPDQEWPAENTPVKVQVAEVIEDGTRNKKELRKQRSQVIAEKSKVLTPLKEKISALEAEIINYENALKEANEGLLQASQNSNVDQFIVLSKSIKDNQKLIDVAFAKLTELTTQYDEKQAAFDLELNSVSDS